MSKKICLIAEVFLWLLLAAGNAAAVFLLWTWTVEGPPDETCLFHLLDKIAKNMVVVEGNKVTLPDGTVLTAMHEDALFEIELQNGAKKLRCVSEGEQWHCTGIQNGKKYDFSEDGKTEFHLTYGNVSAADFNYDHLMDIKTDGDTK